MLDGRHAGRSPQMEHTEAGWEGPGATDARRKRRSGGCWRACGQSTATFRLIGQQTVVAPLVGPEGRRNMDQWDGYPAARDRLLASIRGPEGGEPIPGVAVLTGDIHSSWAFDLRLERPAGPGPDARSRPVAVEVVTPAVSSPPLANTFRRMDIDVEQLRAYLDQAHPHLRWADWEHNGYTLLDLTPEALTAEWYFTGDAREEAFEERFAQAFRMAAGGEPPGAGGRPDRGFGHARAGPVSERGPSTPATARQSRET